MPENRRAGRAWAIGCVRFAFWTLSLTLMFNGLFTIIFGTSIEVDYGGIFSEFGAHFHLYALFFVCLGVTLLFLGAYSFHCLRSDNYFGLTIFGFFVITISAIQIVMGFTGHIVTGYSREAILNHMKVSQNNYTTNYVDESAWDSVQYNLQCCGIYAPEEWFKVFGKRILPNSCCDFRFAHCGVVAMRHNNYFTKGCLSSYTEFTEHLQTGLSMYVILIGIFNLLIAVTPTHLVRRVYQEE
ncbi:tetraspanin-9 [Octopus bimaculoides]|uniref:Tetraspanin n=1 Tax=Octopus bimaculoides TaxID=37653 RepID=A0A0L8HEI7_OCTBM|nr:tetraspanin-9 [Octopus bimaculoides]|eukprot:XP_014772952.1 PREDICTED: tetraspanin-9-like [Octopus bimaculoides]